MSTARDIVSRIDTIILADLQGGSLEDLVDHSVGPVRISRSTTMAELRALREHYLRVAELEDGNPGYVETEMIPER